MTARVAVSCVTRRAVIAGTAAAFLSSAAGAQARTVKLRTYVASPRGMAVTAHLILGRRDAVLVDCAFLIADARAIADLVERSGRSLSRVIVTHAHPDHYLGASTLRARFPNTRFLARPATGQAIAETFVPGPNPMTNDYGDLISMEPVAFEPLTGDVLEVEDARFSLLDFAGGESEAQLALLTRDRRDIIASDLLSNRTHPYLGDRDLVGWRRNLDRVAALGTRWARPGHGQPGPTPTLVDACLRYTDVFEREAARARDAGALVTAMRGRYPGWGAERLLRFSAAAQFRNR